MRGAINEERDVVTPTFLDSESMTAAEKAKVHKAWISFLKSGLSWSKFTEALYRHLYLHCSFIAHYDRAGFFAVYFDGDAEATFRLLEQFDPDKTGQAAELGGTVWRTDDRYKDLADAMRESTRPFLGKLRETVKAAEKARDLMTARVLLAKHGKVN